MKKNLIVFYCCVESTATDIAGCFIQHELLLPICSQSDTDVLLQSRRAVLAGFVDCVARGTR